MQQRGFFVRRMAVVALSLLILMAAQQACAAPVHSQDAVRSGSPQQQAAGSVADRSPRQAPRRVARMTPLWRIMTKPLNAHCKDNMECSTSLCRNGFCRSAFEPAKY